MHGGHTNHLADFSWNLNDPWLLCSAAEDNLLQIWKVAKAIVGHDDNSVDIAEMGREGADGGREEAGAGLDESGRE
jgi:histone-binding protein RBBP4